MIFTWWIRFDDGKKFSVEAEDIQDAIRQVHSAAGARYTYRDMIEARRSWEVHES